MFLSLVESMLGARASSDDCLSRDICIAGVKKELPEKQEEEFDDEEKRALEEGVE